MIRTLARSFGRALGWTALGAALVTFPCAGALAQGADPDPVQLFDEGNKLLREGKTAEAEAKLQQSFDLKPVFDTAANLGDCEMLVGQFRDAAEHLAYAARNFPASGDAAMRTQLEARFREAAAKVGALTIQPSVPGAAIAVDGVKMGVSPLGHDLYVEPGEHTVSATKDGYERASVKVSAPAGERQAVGLTLKLVAGDGGGTPGDGDEEGGGAAVPVAIAFMAGGALMVGIGIGVIVAAGSEADDADTQLADLRAQTGVDSPCLDSANAAVCDEILSARESHDELFNAGLVTSIVGGVLVVSGVVDLIIATSSDSSDPAEAANRPRLWAGPTGAGLTWQTRF